MVLLTTALWADSPRVKVSGGVLEGTVDASTGVRAFKGVPFAAPPVGPLRWREPQPAAPWKGIRSAESFGPRPMQLPIYSDMIFRSPSVSEDCLTLNVWAPPKGKRLPVLVYFYGGGFQAGAADEVRYDGTAMAQRGIVAITVNYRLGVFGFLAHPELTKESPHHASGNYGLLDQAAALRWVQRNAAAFGGDPKRVTIDGESAGSFSVSAQMASPLAKGLIAGAIGESGSLLGSSRVTPLADAETRGAEFGASVGAPTLAALRAIPAQELLEKSQRARTGVVVDGWFFPKNPNAIYAAGEQADVPLLAGWNSAEGGAGSVLGSSPATPEGLAAALRRLYPDRADAAIHAYAATTDEEAKQAATDLAGDRFIGYGTWKWLDLHAKTVGKPTYRYYYAQPRPGEGGANHSAEIEYALGNLDRNPHYAWTDDDRKTSAQLVEYWANFVRTGDPNGPGLPTWPTLQKGSVMRLGPEPRAEADRTRARYEFLDAGGRWVVGSLGRDGPS